jgi:glyoxylase-like metal-dependent hydrolase (beta-lactamase superfamily II)
LLTRHDVIPIHTGDVTFPGWHPMAGEHGGVFAFAIRNSNGVVLFETGVGWGNAFIDKHYQPAHRPLLEVLGEHGVHRDDVQAIVNSHLHFDHCGGNPLFPGVPIHAQTSELTAAHAPYYTALEWVDFPGARYEEHDGDYKIADGMQVLATSGHTVGHQAISLPTADGGIILAGQAIYSRDECAYIEQNGKLPPDAPAENEQAAYLGSALRLIRMDPVELHFSHDGAVWRRAAADRATQTL